MTTDLSDVYDRTVSLTELNVSQGTYKHPESRVNEVLLEVSQPEQLRLVPQNKVEEYRRRLQCLIPRNS